jgi:hypothetical protein
MNQRAYVSGAWSDSNNDGKNKTCLMARSSKEVHIETDLHHYDNCSLDSLDLDNEYDKICEVSQKIM